MIDTEERVGLLMRRATDDLSPDHGLVTAAMSAGERRRRGRSIGYGAAVLASLAAIGTGISAVLPDSVERVDIASYGESPAAEPSVPTPAELSAILADALPGESTEVSAEQVDDRVQVERLFRGAAVHAMAFDLTGTGLMPSDMSAYCRNVSRFTGCVRTDDGWAVWMRGRPDVSGAAAGVIDVRVTYYRADGLLIDLSASNTPDDRTTPVATRPVLSRAELIDLATTGDWFPAR